MKEKYVIIKGVKYDAETGLPVSSPAEKTTPTISKVHSIAQNSKAIYDRAAKATVSSVKAPLRKVGHNMDIARVKGISHFARPEVKPISRPATVTKDTGPQKHPLSHRVEKRLSQKGAVAKPVVKTSKQIKDEALKAAMEKPNLVPKSPKKPLLKRLKLYQAILIGVVLILIAGYLTYTNMPSLSVRVADAQAGIDASYPNYVPDGYGVNGPVAFSDGQVTINFHSNTDSSTFTIKQSKSSWDSSAVKNKVNEDSSGQFITTEESGLTIYTYDNSATWVNGGILYTISGNAPLSGDQIRHIATSL